jgi:hypothetical protein
VKSLLWVCLFFAGVSGVVMPLMYFYKSSGLPPLDSEYAIEAQLKGIVEGQRTAARAGLLIQPTGKIEWKRPDFNALPRDLVALYLSQMGCPSYFQSPREAPGTAAWRAFDYAVFNSMPEGANGLCEYRFAARIAMVMHIREHTQLAIAAYRIRNTLQKGDLVAYDLMTNIYAPGVVGVEDASRTLFKRKVSDLGLGELAELALVMPPNPFWDDVAACKNQLLIKQGRDSVLAQLSRDSLVTSDRARLAEEQGLACAKN